MSTTEDAATPLIAIVDDDQAVRDALRRMLRSFGFDAAVFGSAQQFLAEADQVHAACLIADVRMPGMTGIALHDQLTSRGLRLPTILITARPTTGERERAIALGVTSYLAKPLTEQILLDTVRDALENGASIGSPSLPGGGSPGI